MDLATIYAHHPHQTITTTDVEIKTVTEAQQHANGIVNTPMLNH